MSENRTITKAEFEQYVSLPTKIAEVEARVLSEAGHHAMAISRIRAGVEESERLRREILASQPRPEAPPAAPAPAAPAAATAPATATPPTAAQPAPFSPFTPAEKVEPRTLGEAMIERGRRAHEAKQARLANGRPSDDMSMPFGIPGCWR